MFLVLGLLSMLAVFLFQTDGTSGALPGVVPILEGVAAATLTGYLVGFFKKGFPDASGARVVGVAILAGLASAVVASMVNGGIQLTQMAIGTIIMQGVGAAALAAGVNASNKPSVDEVKE